MHRVAVTTIQQIVLQDPGHSNNHCYWGDGNENYCARFQCTCMSRPCGANVLPRLLDAITLPMPILF